VDKSRRLIGTAVGIVALALTATGIGLAATDPNPAGLAKDALRLNGYPPKTGTFLLSVDSGSLPTVSADVAIDFTNDAARASFAVPNLLGAAKLDLLAANNHVYLGTPTLASVLGASWLDLGSSSPNYFGLSLELTRPDIGLITAYTKETVTKHGYDTTYAFTQPDSSLSLGGLKVPAGSTVHYSITVGSQGEVVGGTLAWRSNSSNVSVSVRVLSYNTKFSISPPPKGSVRSIDSSAVEKLLGPDASTLRGLLSPSTLFSTLLPG